MRTRGHLPGWIAAAAGAAACAATLAAAPTPPAPPAGPPTVGGTVPGQGSPVRIEPRAHPLSVYDFEGRYELATKDITVDSPPAYHDSFAFWIGKLKGRSKYEVYRIDTRTLEAKEDGSVPFIRQVPRFNVEIEDEGKTRVPYDPLEQILSTWKWEGSLDKFGNVLDVHKTAGRDDEALKNITMPFVLAVFPALKAPADMRVGGTFTEERIVPLPEKPNINGLEEIKVRMTRVYSLKEVRGTVATFDVAVTYGTDPSQTISVPDTTCDITGGGHGETTFDLKQGVFTSAHLPTSMTIAIVAPLRPLPDRPETANPGTATTKILLDIAVSGTQNVTRPWGDGQN